MSSAGSPTMVDVTGGGASSLGSLAPTASGSNTGGGSDPYSIFNSQLANMLVTAQNQNTNNNTLLGGAENTLQTESVAPGGAQPANPQIFSNDQVTNQQNLQKGFQPAVTSINTQLTNSQNNMAQLTNTITGLQAAEQPLVLQPGQSLVSRDGKVLQQGHSYTVQTNPMTGLPDGFDQNTGTWASADNANNATTTPPTSNASLVGGIDFSGASTSTQPYATDPNYSSEVDAVYNQLLKVNGVPSAAGLDSFITAQIGGKGAVTGQMIMQAAAQYGVDPNILAATLSHESDFGTAGAAVKTMNPGNVGNTGTSTQAFASWQQGVNAAALALAKRMPGNTNAGPSPTAKNNPGTSGQSNIGGQFSPAAQAKVAKLQPQLQQYVQAGPAGVAYIDSTRVPDPLQQGLMTQASAASIPYLAAGDVGAMQSIVQAQQNLNLMETTAKAQLSSGLFGASKDIGESLINDMTLGNAFPDMNKFNSYATEAINLIKGLAGGTGSGLRMTQSEISTAQANIPGSTDTITNAMDKVQVLQGLIYTRISSVFPDAQVLMVNSQGQQGYVPASQYSDAIGQGYTTP